MVADELMKKQLFFIMTSAVMFSPVGQAFGADIVLDNSSSPTTISAGDYVTVSDHAGADGNTTTH